MIAPALGPDPVWVRMRPSTSSTRSASRTLERPTPSSAESARSPGRRSPGASSPSSRRDSTCSSTACQARGVSDATDAMGACVAWSAMSDAAQRASRRLPCRALLSPPRCGLTTVAHVVRPQEATAASGPRARSGGTGMRGDPGPGLPERARLGHAGDREWIREPRPSRAATERRRARCRRGPAARSAGGGAPLAGRVPGACAAPRGAP